MAEAEHGLPDARLDATNLLVWWGHLAHDRVESRVVGRIKARVLGGIGLIALHCGHLSKIFRRPMGTSCNLRWREADDRELVWSVAPSHPIVAGVQHPLILPRHEMYGEFFDMPAPDALLLVSSFIGGEVLRSGCCFEGGKGRVFYFSSGHETYAICQHPDVRRVLCNAAHWAAAVACSPLDNRRSIESATGWFES